MSIIYQERVSDSPLIATVTHGHTVSGGSSLRPAENAWHMVFVKDRGGQRALIVGPWTTAGVASWEEGAEILWIRFKPGTFMPELPFRTLLDRETALPEASHHSFWLGGVAWQSPDFEHAETFVEWLGRKALLLHDPIVGAVLEDQTTDTPSRTVRHHFLKATGLTQSHMRQVERAREAADHLRQGVSIADTVYMAGYADQPHLTRALKKWLGHTPAQLLGPSR